ncbi:VOC family protein [Microbacterium kyungheense]|uniref:Putative glyoxalase superfamily protein PhnB n=1 Tax=Microbacterium kyungheense TaxID=1263636 RepID=A0A543EQ71_9MICO|nr:VOC family protein [Microbacterium kyungheense]TQM23738.1 putative glyoxalase superfamily protein PhnB [Microbacterium kyungheense]
MAVRSLFPILLTRDLPALVRFYESALDATVSYRFGNEGVDDYVSLKLGDASLGIGRDPDALPPSVGDRVELWFYVDDVDAVYAAWLAAGGRGVEPPADMPWGERVAQVRDPGGNLVNLGAEARTTAAPDAAG